LSTQYGEPRFDKIMKKSSDDPGKGPASHTGVDRAGKLGGVVAMVNKLGGRHSAITDKLHSLHGYKVWAEKMKRDFDDEGSEKPRRRR